MSSARPRALGSGKTRSALLLAGSFAFAFLLGEAVHEFGHYLAHRAYGTGGVGVHLDPFGGSHIVGVGELPLEVMGVTSLAGPLLNLVVGSAVFLLFWRWRRPLLLPLLVWGPVAMVQEGVTLSLGLMTPGGDAAWMVAWGVPQQVLVLGGLGLLSAGVLTLSWLFPTAGLEEGDSFWRKFGVMVIGIILLMAVRAIHSLAVSPASFTENLVPLIFSVVLTFFVVALHKSSTSLLRRVAEPAAGHAVTWGAAATALIAGTAMFVFQMVALG